MSRSTGLEKRTIEAMIRIYCRKNHRINYLCEDCRDLLAYSSQRIDKCPFGIEKPACNQCTVHCYNPKMKEKIRQVMRFSGPKMIYKHPVMTIRHMSKLSK